MTHKIAMRRRLADAGVPQPRFAAVRTLSETTAGGRRGGVPGSPEAGGQRRAARRVPRRVARRRRRHLHEALVASPTGEAILEEYVHGTEMNGIVVARDGEGILLTLSDRMRPPGIGFGVGWIHVYPPTISPEQLSESERVAVHTVHALGLRTGIAFPQLIAAPDGRVIVVECAARIPGGQMADLVRLGGRRRSRRGAAADGARRRASRRARAAAVRAAARDPLPHGVAGAAADRGRAADRPARQGARVPRRRAGGRLPAGRRDDPPRAARRRPARLRDRDRRTRTSRRSSEPRRRARLLDVEVE